ncbi:MAG: RNA 2',3'-cyclic phosphodiesterase [Methanospirillum sp.]
MVRTFVAVDLPEEMRERIAVVAQALRGSAARLTFVAPSQIHVTLAFLGEVDATRLDAVADALEAVRPAPFELAVGPIVGNSRSSPRTIWCPCTDEGSLAALAGDVGAALEPLGFSRERRAFRGHATVARVKVFHPSLLDRLASLPRDGFGSFTVDRFRLKKSTLLPQGPVYEDLAEVVL